MEARKITKASILYEHTEVKKKNGEQKWICKDTERKENEKTFENLMKESIKGKMHDKWRNGKKIMQLNFYIK